MNFDMVVVHASSLAAAPCKPRMGMLERSPCLRISTRGQIHADSCNLSSQYCGHVALNARDLRDEHIAFVPHGTDQIGFSLA